ncbi:acyl-CoA dehydrogenase family protein [Allokutzneria sp. A3M-2-11 16]|uniref:acyl-CoA dehydrogenase family protein n=1 Tax=Allokutzneria sp. A3M-2-11 16 TaxID=2962043 RepID=UPI0020B852F8|nr:acyl-CoA dehydrogenase [Allokutzneria sp. A3M-2-11 16]MCP3804673.1 acyl-CoA dehydrogenase family protein [Allokutzneria sp. A3M-2-11 16]
MDTPGSATVLRTLLDGRWADLRERTRKRLGVIEAPPPGLDRERHREHVLRQLRVLASAGHSSVGFPVRYGGDGDFGGSVVAFEMLGFGDLSLMVKAGVQWGLFGGAVQALGTERHHERHLREIIELDLLGCFAMTESGHGSDVQHLNTTASYDAATGEFVVHTPDASARKDYIGNAARDGRMAVVFAQLITGGDRHGVHALLVPIREPDGSPRAGVTIEDCGEKAGLNGVDNGRLSFDHVRVPREALLDRYGHVAEDGTYSSPVEGANKRFFTMLGTLVRGRISVAGGALSATKKALTIAVRHGEARRQFAKPDGTEVPILDYLAHQRRLLPALATTYALHFAQEELVTELHEVFGGDSDNDQRKRELESQAAGLKAAATGHATRTIQECREACGGAGYLAENQLPQLKADTDVFTTFEGDNTVLLQLVAKGLLTGYRDHVGDLDAFGMARFVATQLVGAVIERTPVRSLMGGDLHDRAWQLKLFTDREEHVLDGLVRRLRKAGEGDAFDVFNNAQDHVLRAARTHVDRIVLEAFVAAIERCPDAATAELLERVCDLHVLATIEADLAWFLGHGRLTPARAKSVTSAVNDLCAQLRPRATELVEAFGVPMEWITAPIAQR